MTKLRHNLFISPVSTQPAGKWWSWVMSEPSFLYKKPIRLESLQNSMLQERKVRHRGCVYSNLIPFPFQPEVAHDYGLLCLLTCPVGLHGFPWAVAVFWNSMSPPLLQLDRAQAIYGQKSSLNLDHKYLLNKELFWGNPGGLSCEKKHGSWDLQWITEAKIPSYKILSQAFCWGNTECV